MKHRIFHMNSFSRSGETLLLRALDAHPNIHVVHQVREPDTQADLDLWHFLMSYKPKEIDHSHELIQNAKVKPGAVLVLKNAVWTHKHSHNGFVLARNPFAVANSFKIVQEDEEKFKKRKLQYIRWAKYIAPEILPFIKAETDSLTSLCALYNVKMGPLVSYDQPIIRYEEFVSEPKHYLMRICRHLGCDWDEAVLNSHERYEEGEYGHGRIPLWKPIHQGSLHSYLDLPIPVFQKVHCLTKQVYENLGYRLVDGKIEVKL